MKPKTRTSHSSWLTRSNQALPEGSRLLRVTESGASAWVKTIKIDMQLTDGTFKSYFKKVIITRIMFCQRIGANSDGKQGAPGNRGREMMEGTFESENTVHFFIPDNVPTPQAWGSYKSIPNMHFYICEYLEMTDDLPDPARFGQVLAKLHNNSMGKSPTGKYGFHLNTHLAFVPNNNTWTDTWTEWFTNAMKKMFDEEERSHGVDEELNQLKLAMYEKVIPRLLRPMETGENFIEPCLCHSDVWPGNVKPDAATDEVMMFDSCAFWGHHECWCSYETIPCFLSANVL